MEDKNKKIIFVSSSGNLSGVPKHILYLASGLKKLHWDVKVIAPNGPFHELLAESHIESIVDELSFGSIPFLRKIFEKDSATILHFQGSKAGFIGRIASFGLFNPKFYTEHNWTNDYSLKQSWRTPLHLFLLNLLASTSDRIICVSKAVQDFYVTQGIASAKKLRLVYNGVEFRDIHKHVQTDEVVIGTVGSLVKRKGIDLIIKAMAKENRKIRLIVVGTGEESENLHKLTESLNMSHQVEWLGEISDLKEFWSRIDMFVQASHDESFGMALVEALGNGIPVIASAVGAVPELVKDGEFLFASGDVDQLTEKIERMISHLETYKNKAQEDKHLYKEKFGIERMVKETVEVYKEVVQTSG